MYFLRDYHFCSFKNNVIVGYQFIPIRPISFHRGLYISLLFWPSLMDDFSKLCECVIITGCFSKGAQSFLTQSHMLGGFNVLSFFEQSVFLMYLKILIVFPR